MATTGRRFEVAGPLSYIVKHFYTTQTTAADLPVTHHLSPNYEMMLTFNFGSPVRMSFAGAPLGEQQLEQVVVLGPLRKMLNYEMGPAADLLIVIFNLDGFYRLFQAPVDELDGELLHHHLITSAYQELWQILRNTVTIEERIQILSDYILTSMHDAEDAALPLLQGADYFKDPLMQPAKAIAADADLSERSIQLRFKKYVGYSPKEMLRFLRFKQVMNAIETSPGKEVDWYDLIHDFGYHDQSHLIKDFHHYLGTTPEVFVKQIAGKEFCTTGPGKHYS